MNDISKEIKELISEVFSENDYLSNDDMAFIFLDCVRVTLLEDMKSDFKLAVRESLKDTLQFRKILDHLFSNRQLEESYVEKLVNKTLELLSLKILNADNSIYNNGMGEFLYEGYTYINYGILNYDEIFLKDSVGKKFWVSGRVLSKRVQKGKEDKDFAYLTIDNFYDGPKLRVLIPKKLYDRDKDLLIDIEGKSFGAEGIARYNDFFKTNIIIAFNLETPGGYIIERKPV